MSLKSISKMLHLPFDVVGVGVSRKRSKLLVWKHAREVVLCPRVSSLVHQAAARCRWGRNLLLQQRSVPLPRRRLIQLSLLRARELASPPHSVVVVASMSARLCLSCPIILFVPLAMCAFILSTSLLTWSAFVDRCPR